MSGKNRVHFLLLTMVLAVPAMLPAGLAGLAGAAASGKQATSTSVPLGKISLRYSATVSDSDNCIITNGGLNDFCADDVSYQGGDEHVIRNFAGAVTARAPIKTSNNLATPGSGSGTAGEKDVTLSASNTYSNAQAGGQCFQMDGTASEKYAGTTTSGPFQVTRLKAIHNAQGVITNFVLHLGDWVYPNPGENVSVTDNTTSALPQSCVGTTVNSFQETHAIDDIGLTDYDLGLLNPTPSYVIIKNWKMNPDWKATTGGVLAKKTIDAKVAFRAPDHGPITVNQTFKVVTRP